MGQEIAYYDIGKTIFKAAKAIGVFGSGAGAAIAFPGPDSDWIQWVGFVLLCLPSLWDGFANWYKHRHKGSPQLPPAAATGLVFFLCTTLALSGCVGMAPAVAGKTHYNVEFSDVTADQATNYKMDIKAPAGVDIASVAGMDYGWKPDGSGQISVSSQQNVDTTVQAAMITEVSRQQVEAFKAGMDSALNALAPLLGQYLQSKDNRAAIEAASDSDRARLLAETANQKP